MQGAAAMIKRHPVTCVCNRALRCIRWKLRQVPPLHTRYTPPVTYPVAYPVTYVCNRGAPDPLRLLSQTHISLLYAYPLMQTKMDCRRK